MLKTVSHIEFDKYLQYVENHTHSEPGKEYLSTFFPSTDQEFIVYRLNLINNIQKMILEFGDITFYGLSNVQSLFHEIKSLTFNFEEFKAIINTIRIGNNVATHISESTVEYPIYSAIQITPFPQLIEIYNRIFDDEGNILDSASPALKSIRRKIRHLKERIQHELYKTINDSQLNIYLQDKIITKRNDRFVVPVKEGFVNTFEGISHGRSSSGASVYVEPKVVVHLNNDVSDLISAEKEEIYKIFCEFTKQIRDFEEPIINNYEILRKLDTYFACARVSNEIQAIVPDIVNENLIELNRVRHPLLIIKFKSIKKVIPFNLTLGKNFNVLLISGPNTGGKTITLKTIGLCTLMALTGLPIPANYGSKIGIMSNVFADIGDNQSIESSLSTFSGHIENIKQIVTNGNRNSLVLIDEIGSATDPEQGAALAQAILENIIEKEALAVITTHYTSLKLFVENTPLCVNASMQFDPEKHEPTYRFDLGFPGNSFAIEIAAKLGLDTTLLKRAKELTGTQNMELTDLIKKVNDEKKKLSDNNLQLEIKTRLCEMKKIEFDKKLKDLENEKKQLIKSSLSETMNYLTGIQKRLNEELTEIKKLDKLERKQKLNDLANTANNYRNDIHVKQTNIDKKIEVEQNLEIGNKVWVKSFDAQAVIIGIHKDLFKVEMNGIFFNVKKDDLFLFDTANEENIVSSVSRQNVEYTGKVNIEINLLGKTFDESLPMIQELIDNAMFCGLNSVRIVHGRGTGILRQKIRSYLRKHDNVNDFFSAVPEAGGDGVTVVQIKN